MSPLLLARRGAVAGVASLIALSGCRLVKNGTKTGGGPAGAEASSADDRAKSDWARITAYAERKAAPLKDLQTALAGNLAAAVQQHGRAGDGARPVVFALVDGTIVDVDVASRAGTIGVDVSGDGKADADVQIGPVIRGSALRDGLDFVDFTQFANQIDFAEYGKALNRQVRDVVLKGVGRTTLKGRHLRCIGAYFVDSTTPTPLLTPVTFVVGQGG